MTIEEAISLSFAAVLALCLILWGILVCYNRKLKTALNQRDYFRERRDAITEELYKTELEYERCAYDKENYRIDNSLLQQAMVNCRIRWLTAESSTEVSVYRPTFCQCNIVAKRFTFNPHDPDDREFAYNCAVELCDKLNEK